jgi:hypothetical protein
MPFVPQDTQGITSAEIYGNYKVSTEKQTLTSHSGEIYLPPRHEENTHFTEKGLRVLPGTGVGWWA